MVDLRNMLAFSICEYDEEHPGSCGCGGVCSNTHAIGQADAILAALDAAGLVVVPREPTEEMGQAWHDADLVCRDEWQAMLAASPYAKKEVE